MSKLSTNDIKNIAKLAKLKLTKKETILFSSQLAEILDYIKQLEEVNTQGIIPTAQTTGLENSLREDEIKPNQSLSQKKALSGSNLTYNGYFKVPMVLKRNG